MDTTKFLTDIKAVLKKDKAAMLRVAKNPAYFKIALGVYALVQVVATIANQWLTMRSSMQFMEALGIQSSLYGPIDMLKQGVYGFIMGIFLMAIIYFAATRLFKGKEEVDVKGFITIYCFVISPMLLLFIPLIGFFALIWVLFLFFAMMDAVFGFKFWKALIVVVVAMLGWAVVAGPLSQVLGVSTGFSTDFSFDF
jgi:hypothetical protein